MPALGSYTINIKGSGPRTFATYEELEAEFREGTVHPGDLKPACAEAINKLIQPVRDHFKNDVYARDLLATIKGWNEEI
jgi:tyrosyl-tRNA synthetase